MNESSLASSTQLESHAQPALSVGPFSISILGFFVMVKKPKILMTVEQQIQLMQTGVYLAEEKLAKAQVAYDRLTNSESLDEQADAWVDFIAAAATIYAKLEQGAKSSGKNQAWWGRVKNARKKDQLLSYIHLARNADQHGLRRVLEKVPGAIGIGYGDECHLSFTPDDPNAPLPKIWVYPLDSGAPTEPLEAQRLPPIITLVRVHDDRHSTFKDPPTEHKGKKIEQSTPGNVAKLALQHLQGLVNEARSRIGK